MTLMSKMYNMSLEKPLLRNILHKKWPDIFKGIKAFKVGGNSRTTAHYRGAERSDSWIQFAILDWFLFSIKGIFWKWLKFAQHLSLLSSNKLTS